MNDAEKAREAGALVVHGAYSHHSTASVFCPACTEVERDALVRNLREAEERAGKAEAIAREQAEGFKRNLRLGTEELRTRIQELEAALRRVEETVGVGAADIVVANTVIGRVKQLARQALAEDEA